MKLITAFTILILIASLQTFSQDKKQREIYRHNITNYMVQEIHKPIADGLDEINLRESLRSSSKNKDWKSALRNQRRDLYEEEGFNAKDTRTTTNKTHIGNGFLMTEEIVQRWESSVWVNAAKLSHTYDGSNNLTERLRANWAGSAWVNYSKYSYPYDGNNNLAEMLLQFWTDSAWINQYKYSYTNDGNNSLTEILMQDWVGSAWINLHKHLYTYNGNNNLTEERVYYWEGFDWANSSKYSYTYDGNNNLTEILLRDWDGSAWVNSIHQLYTYDVNNNQTEFLWQTWDGSAWLNSSKHSYTYDVNNNQTESLSQTWNSSVWVHDSKTLYTYDVNNNQTESLSQTWNGSNWVNEFRVLSTYIQVTAVNENFSSVNSYSLSNNYPNPFNPSTIINYSIPTASNVKLEIFNITGEKVATLVDGFMSEGYYEVSFSASSSTGGLPSGMYLYRISAGAFVQTRKMILLR